MQEKNIKKLYYSISEVSQITSLKKHVLRYWESEFPALQPGKNRAGNRTYKLEDIKILFLIKKLLYEEKFTIEGAKQKLKSLLSEKNNPYLQLSLGDLQKGDLLMEIRRELRSLLEFIDNKEHAGTSPADDQ